MQPAGSNQGAKFDTPYEPYSTKDITVYIEETGVPRGYQKANDVKLVFSYDKDAGSNNKWQLKKNSKEHYYIFVGNKANNEWTRISNDNYDLKSFNSSSDTRDKFYPETGDKKRLVKRTVSSDTYTFGVVIENRKEETNIPPIRIRVYKKDENGNNNDAVNEAEFKVTFKQTGTDTKTYDLSISKHGEQYYGTTAEFNPKTNKKSHTNRGGYLCNN